MTRWPYVVLILPVAILSFCISACTRHEVAVQPLEIKPIHITIDVNVKVDRALDDFFSDIDEAASQNDSKQ